MRCDRLALVGPPAALSLGASACFGGKSSSTTTSGAAHRPLGMMRTIGVKRLGDNPVVIEFASDGAKIEVAAKAQHRALVSGP